MLTPALRQQLQLMWSGFLAKVDSSCHIYATVYICGALAEVEGEEEDLADSWDVITTL